MLKITNEWDEGVLVLVPEQAVSNDKLPCIKLEQGKPVYLHPAKEYAYRKALQNLKYMLTTSRDVTDLEVSDYAKVARKGYCSLESLSLVNGRDYFDAGKGVETAHLGYTNNVANIYVETWSDSDQKKSNHTYYVMLGVDPQYMYQNY